MLSSVLSYMHQTQDMISVYDVIILSYLYLIMFLSYHSHQTYR